MLKIKQATLLAMLAFPEGFTVEALRTKTGMKETTVRGIIERERGKLEEMEGEPTGLRGGQPKRYRLRPEARAALQKDLDSARRAMGVMPAGGAAEEDPLDAGGLEAESRRPIPGSLKTAEYLLTQLPAAARGERVALVRQIEKYMEAAGKALARQENHDNAWHQARSRLDLAEVTLSYGALRRFIDTPILVASLDEPARAAAAQISGMLQTCFDSHDVDVVYAEPMELSETLPTSPDEGANLVIFTLKSMERSEDEAEQMKALLEQSASNALTMVVDYGNDESVARLALGCRAHYVSNFSLRKSRLLEAMRDAGLQYSLKAG